MQSARAASVSLRLQRCSTIATALAAALAGALLARCLLSESYVRIPAVLVAPVAEDLGPTALTATVLDLLVLLLSALILWLAPGRGSAAAAWRRLGRWAVGLGLFLLLIGVLVSWRAASEPRPALLAGMNVWISVAAALALARAAADRALRLVLVAALIAGGATISVKCAVQRFIEAPDTIAAFAEHKRELLARGVQPDDPMIVNFERRAASLARESTGFHYHANITASGLAAALLVTLGLFAAALRSAPARAGPVVVAAVLVLLTAYGLWLTGSTGAFAASLCGVGVLLALLHRRLAAHPWRLALLCVSAYVALAAAGALYGTWRDTLPHPSLAFRWYYWKAAAAAWLEAPWTGIGRLNFGDYYLRLKDPGSVEDVKDPHNVWLSLLVEMGPCALAGAGLLLLAALSTATARLPARGTSNEAPHECGLRSTGALLPALVAPAAFALTHAVFGGVAAPEVITLWSFEVLGVWSIAYIASLAVLFTTQGGAAQIQAGLLAAMAAMLVHGLVDFALVTPAGAAFFALLVGAACAATGGATMCRASTARRLAALAAVPVGAVLAVNALALARIDTALRELRLLPIEATPRLDLRTAFADPDDPDAARLAAERITERATRTAEPAAQLDLLGAARDLLELSLHYNPHSEQAHRRLAVIFDAVARIQFAENKPQEGLAALRLAAAHWQRAVALSPANPRTRLAAARALLAAARHGDDAILVHQARENLETARRIDDLRPPGDTARLSADQRTEIEELLAAMPPS